MGVADDWAALAGRAHPGATDCDAPPDVPVTLREREHPARRLPAVPKATSPAIVSRALPAVADARDGTLGTFALTELGTAERLVARHGDNVKYIPEVRSWLIWQEGHWIWDRDGARVRTLAAGLYEEIYREGCRAGAEAGHFCSWARKCQSEAVIRRVVSLAADMEDIRIPVGAVDGDPLLVGLDGARLILDLNASSARPARREDYVTRCVSVAAVGQTAKALRWRKFLDEVFQGDQSMIDWMHRYLGYCLTGLTREHIFVFAWGAGANGKSVLLSVCQRIWSDYGRVIQPETLMAQMRSGSGPSPDLSRLAGARLVLGSETEEGRELAEALIKQLTGGDTITARDLHSSPFEFRPMLKLVLAGNYKPKIRGTDVGIWRRMRLLPFSRSFAPAERDHYLADKLIAESEHIVGWLVEGYGEYRKRGLADIPQYIAQATSEYRSEEDIVGLWAVDRTSTSGETGAGVLYADFRAWCSATGSALMSSQAFGRRLGSRGLVKTHTRNGAVYAGIELRGVMV